MRSTDAGLSQERDSRTAVEGTIRSVQSLVTEVDNRVRRSEESLRENQNAIQQLLSHTRNVEKAVTAGQQDILARRDQQVLR